MSLDIRHTIEKLERYNDSPAPILSLYLEVPHERKFLVTWFKQLIERGLSHNDQKDLNDNILYIQSFLENYMPKPAEKGIALFSGGENLFEIVTTSFPFPSLLTVNHSPFLEPLVEQLEIYQRYLVIVADKQKALFFTIYGNELEDQNTIHDSSVPQKVKGRNASELQKKFDNHTRMHLKWHFDYIGEKAEEFINKKDISAVLIASHKQFLGSIEKSLPNRLSEKLIGGFIGSPDEGINSLLEKSKTLIQELNTSIHDLQDEAFHPVFLPS